MAPCYICAFFLGRAIGLAYVDYKTEQRLIKDLRALKQKFKDYTEKAAASAEEETLNRVKTQGDARGISLTFSEFIAAYT